MFYRPWKIHRPDAAASQALQDRTGLQRLACDVLLAREAAADGLPALLSEAQRLPDPMSLSGMAAARSRILSAVDAGERIAIFGDYDVDGVTATALLYLYLDSIGAEVYYKLPSREDEGYGLSPSVVEFMEARRVKLIVTVDNGVSANEAIALAKARGMDVVVTDHHLPPETLPEAAAIVDPQLLQDAALGVQLCGAGVALLLTAALEDCTAEEMLPFYADLAAIGTVADMMPLTGANRTLVKAGLALLQNTERAGLAALIQRCGLAEKEITAENIAYALAPRLNAAGRMDSAGEALELLLCEDPEEAAQRADALEAQNAARQSAEQEITRSVLEAIAADPAYAQERILVVAGEGFHPGVIGIVASRMVERFGKPVIVISIDENGEGKGSGRSLGGISLYHAIAACSKLLLRYGGHALAAGLSVTRENIPALRRAINAWAAQEYVTFERPALEVDAPVQLGKLTPAEVQSLDALAPFGHGNPTPLCLVEHAVIEGVYPLSDGKHSRLRLRQENGVLYAVLFGCGPQALVYAQGDVVDAVVSLSVYEGKTGPMVSGRIRELRCAGMTDAYLQGTQLYDALQCGAPLTAEQSALLTPDREEVAEVYRTVRRAADGVPADDLRPLFCRMGEQRAGRILVALEALRELGLIEVRNAETAPHWIAVPNPAKQDLAVAPVLCRLRQEG